MVPQAPNGGPVKKKRRIAVSVNVPEGATAGRMVVPDNLSLAKPKGVPDAPTVKPRRIAKRTSLTPEEFVEQAARGTCAVCEGDDLPLLLGDSDIDSDGPPGRICYDCSQEVLAKMLKVAGVERVITTLTQRYANNRDLQGKLPRLRERLLDSPAELKKWQSKLDQGNLVGSTTPS